jgi:hypothetical protein
VCGTSVARPRCSDLVSRRARSGIPARGWCPSGTARRHVLSFPLVPLDRCRGVGGRWRSARPERADRAQVNDFPAQPASEWQPPYGMVIAHDVLGGVYALNPADPAAWRRPGKPGEVVYFAPDSMTWQPLKGGYGAWLSWILSRGLERFYEGLRWPGWEAEPARRVPSPARRR